MTPIRIKTRPWDSAGHLRTEQDIAGYVEACLQDSGDDPTFIAHVRGVVARARDRHRSQKSLQGVVGRR